MRRGTVVGIGLVALIAALLMLQLTTPSDVGLFGVLVFFVLVYITCACLLYAFLVTLAELLANTLPQGKWRMRFENLKSIKVYYYASILALTPVILVGMSSVGAIGVADLALLAVFEVLACFYISRRF